MASLGKQVLKRQANRKKQSVSKAVKGESLTSQELSEALNSDLRAGSVGALTFIKQEKAKKAVKKVLENNNTFDYLETRIPITVGKPLTDSERAAISLSILTGVDPAQKFRVTAADKNVPDFEREQRNFILDEPEILMVCEYFVENEFSGLLIVFESYKQATHYEVFKKNTFKAGSDFERILFLDEKNLKDETKNFIDYIKFNLGFSNIDSENVFVVLDDFVKRDRIYEYQVAAAKIPSQPLEVDYDLILESKGLLVQHTLKRGVFLADLGKTFYTDEQMGWLIALLNPLIPYFGEEISRNPIRSVISIPEDERFVYATEDVSFVEEMIKESISLFGITEACRGLLTSIGGLPETIIGSFLNSINQESGTFSRDQFKSSIREKFPVFKAILNVAEGAAVLGRQAELPVTIPNESGELSLTNIREINLAMSFVNKVYVASLVFQDDEALEELRLLQAQLKRDREKREEQRIQEEIFERGFFGGPLPEARSTGDFNILDIQVLPSSFGL